MLCERECVRERMCVCVRERERGRKRVCWFRKRELCVLCVRKREED